MGRPTLLTQDLADRIVHMVENLVPPTVAARANGVADSTWHEWMARAAGTVPPAKAALLDPQADARYTDLAERIDAAEAKAKAVLWGQAGNVALNKPLAMSRPQDVLDVIDRRWPGEAPRTPRTAPGVNVTVQATAMATAAPVPQEDTRDLKDRLAEALETNAILKDVLGLTPDPVDLEVPRE